MIYNIGDKLECYSSSGKTVCTISTDGINFEGLDWGDYDYTLDETYYPTNHDSVTLETGGITCKGKTIRSYIDLFNSQFNNLEGEDCCPYCPYNNECSGGVTGGPDGPIYPYCADYDIHEKLNKEAFFDEQLREMFKNKEEKEMNKVLELYVEREKEKITKEYQELRENVINEDVNIKEFNNLINTFKSDLDNLYNKVKIENPEEEILIKTGYELDLPIVISQEYKEHIIKPVHEQQSKAMETLEDFENEINALLSISNDKDYQIEVLTKYDILNKKGMMN